MSDSRQSSQFTGSESPVPKGRQRSVRLRSVRERIIMFTLILCGLFTLLTTLSIIGILGTETTRFFRLEGVSIKEFLFGLQWNPLLGSQQHFGIWPLIAGTFLVTAVAMVVAMPLGLITAVWLSEYAPRRLRNIVKPVLEVLAGVPTVVFGFFALTAITPALHWIHDLFFGEPGFSVYNAASAGIAVGILTLPIVTSLSEDALRAVPLSLREASYGLGATKFETSLKVVFPAALSGVIAAFLLAVARAVGETMIVALAAGSTPLRLHDTLAVAADPRNEVQTMTGYMVQIFLGDASNFGTEYLSSYAVAAVLFLMTFGLTYLGDRIRRRFQQVYE